MAAHAGGGAAEAFDGDEALGGGEEEGSGGGVGEQEAPDAEEEGEGAGEEVDVLPAFEGAGGDLCEALSIPITLTSHYFLHVRFHSRAGYVTGYMRLEGRHGKGLRER